MERQAPPAYAERLAAGRSPGLAREVLTVDEGAPKGDAPAAARRRVAVAVLTATAPGRAPRAPRVWRRSPTNRAVLTLRGRLLADAVVRDLLP